MRALILILALLPSFLSAQDSRPVGCRFLNFGGTDSSASVLATSNKGGEVSCPLSTNGLSDPIVCLATDNKITFLSPADRKPAATATIPASAKNALLVFVPTPSSAAGSSPWRVLVIEDSPKNFPDGGAFVANFYSKDIRFVIGEHKGMLHPAGQHGYAIPTQRDNFNMAPVIVEFLQDENWRTASESSVRFLTGMRYLIFAYVDPASGRPRISTYQDLAPFVNGVP